MGGRLGIARTPPDPVPLPGVLYEQNPQQPGDEGPAPALTHTHVSTFGHFLMSMEGVDFYAN